MRSASPHLVWMGVIGCAILLHGERSSSGWPVGGVSVPQHRGITMVERNARCEGCHQEIALEWRSSMHRQSHTDPSYQKQFAREPLPFCQSCHAPEADPANRSVPQGLSELGVGCVTCHLRGNATLARPSEVAPPAPHAVERHPKFATADACAACHQFPFPSSVLSGTVSLMQETVNEHAASPFRATPCATCHMPLVNGHRSHRFTVMGSDDVIRDSISAVVERDGAKIRARLQARGAGHAVPTGDLFRRIEVLFEEVSEGREKPWRSVRYLARHFEFRRRADGKLMKVVRTDDRLPANGEIREVLATLPDAAHVHPVRYRIAYQRVDAPGGTQDEKAHVEGEVVISEGILPAPGAP